MRYIREAKLSCRACGWKRATRARGKPVDIGGMGKELVENGRKIVCTTLHGMSSTHFMRCFRKSRTGVVYVCMEEHQIVLVSI